MISAECQYDIYAGDSHQKEGSVDFCLIVNIIKGSEDFGDECVALRQW